MKNGTVPKDKKRIIPPVKQDQALKTAFKLLGEHITPRHLHEHLQDIIGYENIRQIAMAIDPKAEKLENLDYWIKAEKAVQAKLDKDGKKLFGQYAATGVIAIISAASPTFIWASLLEPTSEVKADENKETTIEGPHGRPG